MEQLDLCLSSGKAAISIASDWESLPCSMKNVFLLNAPLTRLPSRPTCLSCSIKSYLPRRTFFPVEPVGVVQLFRGQLFRRCPPAAFDRGWREYLLRAMYLRRSFWNSFAPVCWSRCVSSSNTRQREPHTQAICIHDYHCARSQQREAPKL